MKRAIKNPCCDNCQHFKQYTSFYGICDKVPYERIIDWYTRWCYKHKYRKKRGGIKQ